MSVNNGGVDAGLLQSVGVPVWIGLDFVIKLAAEGRCNYDGGLDGMHKIHRMEFTTGVNPLSRSSCREWFLPHRSSTVPCRESVSHPLYKIKYLIRNYTISLPISIIP